MIALLLAAALAAPAPVAASPSPDPAAAFARLKTLVGTWRNADRPQSPLRIHFYTTAGGTVLVEDWRAGDKPHSLTLYHRDGPRLIATHYCPQGNQPRLALTGPGPAFTFADATDLDAATESHQHALAFDLADPTRPVRREIYRSAKGEEADALTLVRAAR